jgi:hypothetical protein
MLDSPTLRRSSALDQIRTAVRIAVDEAVQYVSWTERYDFSIQQWLSVYPGIVLAAKQYLGRIVPADTVLELEKTYRHLVLGSDLAAPWTDDEIDSQISQALGEM